MSGSCALINDQSYYQGLDVGAERRDFGPETSCTSKTILRVSGVHASRWTRCRSGDEVRLLFQRPLIPIGLSADCLSSPSPPSPLPSIPAHPPHPAAAASPPPLPATRTPLPPTGKTPASPFPASLCKPIFFSGRDQWTVVLLSLLSALFFRK